MANALADLLLRYAPTTDIHDTEIPALQIVHADQVQPAIKSLHKPSACFVVQGSKEVSFGGEVLRYGRDQVLVSTVELPLTGEVTVASRTQPYLCLVLELDPSLVVELVSAVEGVAPPGPRVPDPRTTRRAMTVGPSQRPITVGVADAGMADAFHRLVQCLASPLDPAILAPSLVREITYRLLRGPYGAIVRELGIMDSQTHRIAKVIQRLKADFAKPLRTAALAKLAGMSVSSLHDHFRKVTTLSPLQVSRAAAALRGAAPAPPPHRGGRGRLPGRLREPLAVQPRVRPVLRPSADPPHPPPPRRRPHLTHRRCRSAPPRLGMRYGCGAAPAACSSPRSTRGAR